MQLGVALKSPFLLSSRWQPTKLREQTIFHRENRFLQWSFHPLMLQLAHDKEPIPAPGGYLRPLQFLLSARRRGHQTSARQDLHRLVQIEQYRLLDQTS